MRSRVYAELALIFLIFLGLTFVIPSVPKDEYLDTVRSTATFVFAIILGFSIANRHKRLDSIRAALRENDALFLNMYHAFKVNNVKVLSRLRDSLDRCLVKQLDYRLVDIEKSTPELVGLIEEVTAIAPKNQPQKDAKSVAMGSLSAMIKNHKKVGYLVNDRMSVLEWLSLLLLMSIILFCLFSIKGPNFSAHIVSAVLGTTLTLLILVLRELDLLRWQERKWIAKPIIDLFSQLDLLPYLPEPMLKDKVTQKDLAHLKSYRVGVYPHPYPDMSEKSVKVVR